MQNEKNLQNKILGTCVPHRFGTNSTTSKTHFREMVCLHKTATILVYDRKKYQQCFVTQGFIRLQK